MRAKHGGNRHSMDAWASIEPTLHEKQKPILHIARSRITVTCKEAAAHLGVGMNVISGRFIELERLGLIYRTGERRDGSGVWAAVQTPRQMMLGEMRRA